MLKNLMLGLAATVAVSLSGWVIAGGMGGQQTLPTTLGDFFMPGSQPFFKRVECVVPNSPCDDDNPYTENDMCQDVAGDLLCSGDPIFEPLASAQTQCNFCHGNEFAPSAPVEAWKTSLMAQAARDPVFHAALAIAEQDASFSGDTCLRCHAPRAWMEGRSEPTDGSALTGFDYEGVTCHICHRFIDPVYEAGVNPIEDVDELDFVTTEFGPVQPEPHNGSYIIDKADRRRGPLDLDQDYVNFNFHDWRESPFHRESKLCATCHEVSIPSYTRDQIGLPNAAGDTYSLNATDAPHENFDKRDMFPEQRTYSEWLLSDFADGPIDLGGRFGGDNPLVSSCQDCHMPDTLGSACNPILSPEVPERPDLPLHHFLGTANWVLDAILDLDLTLELYDFPSGLLQEDVDGAKARNLAFVQAAADMDLTLTMDDQLNVRITNQCGHKLPTGYPEGRRMWLNVKYADAADQLVMENGAYDAGTAVLEETDTKVYEASLGIDEDVATATGLTAGHTFHLVLNNEFLIDNRIPPRGFSNAEAEANQVAPVNYAYADGQHWDDTLYDIPCEAASAEVTLYYQTTSKDYVEFLRDTNVTDGRGQLVYDLWEANGKSAPLMMLNQTIVMADCNLNGRWDQCDISDGLLTDGDENGIPDQCECVDFTTCADMDGDEIRDNSCIWWACEAGLCAGTAVPYADMGGSNGVCPPDLAADANDNFHALNCFSNQDTLGDPGYPCEFGPPTAYNVDAASLRHPCAADGVCDGNDAFAALNAFTGNTSCSCPLGSPAPQGPGGRRAVGEVDVALAPDRSEVRPGDTVAITVRFTSGVPDLRGYQMHLGVSGGRKGDLELVDIIVDDRKDWVFADSSPWIAFNVSTAQVLAGLSSDGVSTTRGGGYLATFVYRATRAARGTFTVRLLHDEAISEHRTIVFPTAFDGQVAIRDAQPAVIEVVGRGGGRDRVSRKDAK